MSIKFTQANGGLSGLTVSAAQWTAASGNNGRTQPVTADISSFLSANSLTIDDVLAVRYTTNPAANVPSETPGAGVERMVLVSGTTFAPEDKSSEPWWDIIFEPGATSAGFSVAVLTTAGWANFDTTEKTASVPAATARVIPIPTGSATSSTAISVTWEEVLVEDEGGPITQYAIEYSSDGGSNYSTQVTTASPQAITGLTADTEYTIRLAATNSAGTSRSLTSTVRTLASANAAPVITGTPTLTGSNFVGAALTITPASVTGTPTPTAQYDIYDSGNNLIASDVGLSYTVQSGDLTKQLKVRQTETNSEGSDTADSSLTSAITAAPSGSEISMYGGAITFTLDTSYTNGTYWNGDPWVLRPGAGSVTITADTPAATNTSRYSNGAMWNWNTGAEAVGNGAGNQGWDSYDVAVAQTSYNDTRNIAPGRTGSSFVATTEGAYTKAVSRATSSITGQARPQVMSDVGILTIVDSAPPSNAFRPGAHTTNKAHRWTTDDLDLSLFPSGLDAGGNGGGYWTPTYSRHHIMGSLEYNANRIIMPTNHMFNYGAWNAQGLASAALRAMTTLVDANTRLEIIRSLVQIGIDVYDRYNEGGRWIPAGALYCGYKLPLVIAATLLDDANMKAVAGVNPTDNGGDAFCEDRQIWIVSASDVGRSLIKPVHEQYITADIGMPEWGEQHTKQSNRDDRRESHRDGEDGSYGGTPPVLYRSINSRWQIGAATVCNLITGARAVWNYEPFFQYADRIAHRNFYRDNSGTTGNDTLISTYGSANFADAQVSSSNLVDALHLHMARTYRGTATDKSGVAIWDW